MDAGDWLLPQPTETYPTAGLWDADGSLSRLALAEAVEMATEALSVSLPAFWQDGSPVIPPDRHVLDHLSRAWDLVDENTQIDNPYKATTVYVETVALQACDSCGDAARYHGPVSTPEGDAWSWMCVEDARKVVDHLGSPSLTYYVMRADEVPARIRNLVNSRLRDLGREQLFDEP